MNALFSFLLLFLAIIYWVFRVVVCLMATMQLEFFMVACIVLIVKRNIVGPTIYLGLAFAYFGSSIYEKIMAGAGMSLLGSSEVLLEVCGILIPLFMFFDILFNKNKMNFAEARKTEWYFGTDKYDRQYDDRADKNQYRS